MREIKGIAKFQGRVHHVVEHAVNTESYAQLFLVRFDVYVRRAAAQGIDEQHVDETHDGRVFAHARERGEIDLFVVFNYFDVFSLSGFKVDAVQGDEVVFRNGARAI